MDEAHTQLYLNEFVFWFNRIRFRGRGLLLYRLSSSAQSATTRSATVTSLQIAVRHSKTATRRPTLASAPHQHQHGTNG